MPLIIKSVATLLFALTLSACGQKGSLYMPQPEQAPDKPASTAEAEQAEAATHAP